MLLVEKIKIATKQKTESQLDIHNSDRIYSAIKISLTSSTNKYPKTVYNAITRHNFLTHLRKKYAVEK